MVALQCAASLLMLQAVWPFVVRQQVTKSGFPQVERPAQSATARLQDFGKVTVPFATCFAQRTNVPCFEAVKQSHCASTIASIAAAACASGQAEAGRVVTRVVVEVVLVVGTVVVVVVVAEHQGGFVKKAGAMRTTRSVCVTTK